jgi:hypothetical protein
VPRQQPAPVKPSGLELVFFYICPYCRRQMPVPAPLQPSMIDCKFCRHDFPIMPVDRHSVHFVRIMFGDGPAAVDPDYL